MARLTEEFVRNRILEWLSKQGYVPFKVKTLAEHGPDIKAKRVKGNYQYVVEVKGEPEKNPVKMRYPTLVSALGEVVQRVTRAKYCRYAIALPSTYGDLVRRRIPWMAAKRLDLEALLVNSEGRVERVSWRGLKTSKRSGTSSIDRSG